MASHGGKHFVLTLGKNPGCSELRDFGKYIARQLCRIGVHQAHRYGPHRQRVGRNDGKFEAEPGERAGIFRGGRDLQSARGHRGGNQKLLGGDAVVVKRALEFFINDTLVRGMHVNHHQTVLILRQDVDARKLSERKTQWMRRFLRRRSSCALVRQGGRCVSRTKQRGIERNRFVGRELHVRLAQIAAVYAKCGGRRRGFTARAQARTRRGQRSFQSVEYKLVNSACIAEAHFDLGRMDIRIHQRGVELQE